MVREMQHGTLMSGAYVPVKGIGGHSVAQTWRDSFNGSVSASLWGSFLSGDSTVQVTSPNSFPSMYRWKGQLGSEVILFEGASGPINNSGAVPLVTLQAVYRGIDGTNPVSAGSGSAVSQLTPDTNYSVNLITVGKGQYTFPGAITSGGIQESVVVPQVQTVRALSASGSFTSDGSTYYSAQVYYPTPTGGSATASELAYVVDRNARAIRSGAYYEGQLAGFLVSTPIYLIDESKRLVVQNTAGLPPVAGADTIQFNYQQFSVTEPLTNVAQVAITSGGIGSGLLASGVINWYNLGSGSVQSGSMASGFANYCAIDVVTNVCPTIVSGVVTGIQVQYGKIYYYTPFECADLPATVYCLTNPSACCSGGSSSGLVSGYNVLTTSGYVICCSGYPNLPDSIYLSMSGLPSSPLTYSQTSGAWYGRVSGCDYKNWQFRCSGGLWTLIVQNDDTPPLSCSFAAGESDIFSVVCFPFSVVYTFGGGTACCSGQRRLIITI